jgi:glycosyltransferase involved in cell wall biosynthesis
MINMKFSNIGILIPAFNPDEKLINLLGELKSQLNFNQKIIIVDDGSSKQTIFEQVNKQFGEKVVILHHDSNQGKWQALKTGFKYILKEYKQIKGIATIDADGQHKVTDLHHLEEYFMENPDNLVIGGRTFDEKVPLRSRLGNLLTNKLVNVLTGIQVQDTQTGLRIIPIAYITQLISFPSNHYEFEFDMLLATKAAGVKITEVPIQTVYLDNNATSHFRVIHDSLAIYGRFFKFAISGLSSFAVDMISFYVLLQCMMGHLQNAIFFATIISRIISSVFNFAVNQRMVFKTQNVQSVWRYFFLMLGQLIASGFLTTTVSYLTRLGHSTLWISCIKILVDFGLFLISYQIQKKFVFKEDKELEEVNAA